MRNKETIEKVISKDVIVEIKCDNCGDNIAEDFYAVTISHDHWGNDRIESVLHKDICTVECLGGHMKEYFDKYIGEGYHYQVESEHFKSVIRE